jgi:hypothetical protein
MKKLIPLFLFSLTIAAGADERQFYKPSTWQPRVTLPAADALRGDFWPASPPVQVDYSGPGFAEDRLSAVPAPGVHPRVFFSPSDIELIRKKVALGDKAPIAFRKLWELENKARTPFYALVTQDNDLGKELAAKLAEKAAEVEPKVDSIQRRPGLEKENLWALRGTLDAEKSPDAEGANVAQFFSYDYLYQWLTPAQRNQVRRVVAKMTAKKSTNFLEVPDHFMTNNHLSFGMGELVPVMLAIEGEEGYDRNTFERAAHKVRAHLTYYFSPSGMCYETIKGWLNTPVYLAVARRERDLLKHGHLLAKMQYQLQAARWQDGGWRIREEMRNSAFHVNFLMHYFYPNNPAIDFLYKASLATHHLDDDTPPKEIPTVGCSSDVLLFLADDGMVDASGKPYSCEDQARLDALKAPLTWSCPQRGYMEARNSWRKDDLHVSLFGKQDFLYNGHEGPEQGRFLLWKDGVNWAADLSMLFNKTTADQQMVTVDGKGSQWAPVSSKWLGVIDTPQSATACVDYKDAYSYTKAAQVHPFTAPELATARFGKSWSEGNFVYSRDLQLPFHDVVVKFMDGYGHTDYGTWNGETRVTENYRDWNPMMEAYRTLHLARGKFPYLLFFDDLRKDDQPHLYEWNMTLPGDVEMLRCKAIDPGATGSPAVMCDMIFGKIDTPRKAGLLYSGVPELSYQPKKGDPLLLVRVLYCKSGANRPMPHFERMLALNKISVPAISVEPEFRILVYPHKFGDPLPTTEWNREHTALTVEFPGQKDSYQLDKTDGGRTVFVQERDGKVITSSKTGPAQPVLQVRGRDFDAYANRYTRYASRIPEFLVDQPVTVSFPTPQFGTEIRYTLDGSEPGRNSTRYDAPFAINSSAKLCARTIAREWPFGPDSSEVVKADFRATPLEAGEKADDGKSSHGLLLKLYEILTVPYNDKGFFDAGKIMLPDLRREKPVSVHAMADFQLPHATPATPQREQRKAFYQFTGRFNAPADGIYEFAVNSCGPVTLDIGKQVVIEEIGQYHQNQKIRRGEAALAAGWHTLALVVCDPLFWKVNMDDEMPFGVTYRLNGGPGHEINADQLACNIAAESIAAPPEIPRRDAVSLLVEPGLELSSYDRKDKERDNDYLDIDDLAPFLTDKTSDLAPNANENVVDVYNGFFLAQVDGVYTFNAPARTFGTYDRNQIRLGNEVVVQRGVPGRNPLRKIFLKAGYHPISLRLGLSRSDFSVIYPGATNEVRLTATGLFRPVRVAITPAEHPDRSQKLFELFKPADFTLTLPLSAGDGEIHCTLDGKEPGLSSPKYAKPIKVDKDMTITAVAFKDGKPLTKPSSVRCEMVNLPKAGLLGYWDFRKLKGPLAPPVSGNVIARIDGASMVTDPAGPALQLSGKKMGLQLVNLGMVANALTVSMWVKMEVPGEDLLTDAKYHPIVVTRCVNKTFEVRGAGRGGVMKTNEWQHLVFTWNGEEAAIYVDGTLVNRQKMRAELHTDSLDMFLGYKGLVRSLRVYNKELSPEEVAQISEVEGVGKKP